MDWARRHLFDLSYAAEAHGKTCADDTVHQRALEELAANARRLSKGFPVNPDASANDIVGKLCATCRSAGMFGCAGRWHWMQPCDLITAQINMASQPSPHEGSGTP